MALPLRSVSVTQDRLESINPATGESLGDVPAATADQARAAVACARHAQPAWGALSARERGRVLLRLRDVVIERYDEIAATERRETGKPLAEAEGILLAVADMCRYYARLAADWQKGRRVASGALLGKRGRIHVRPLGVAAVISPWNYPFHLAMLQIVPALAAGNAVVHKPSEHTPRVGLLIGNLCRAAGVPEGIVEVVVGDGAIGAAIIDAPVDVVAFTGAPATGRGVMEAAARHLTPVVLELGGKDAAIVCADADLERAANGITWGAFINAGQTCIAVKRAIVADAVYDRFVDMVGQRARALVPGAGDDAQVGALTMEREIERLERQIASSVTLGARRVAGGERLPGPGVFFAPTVLADCTAEMPAVKEETFGPLLTILRASDDEDALRLANASEYGLGGSVWTRNAARAQRLSARMHTGSVCVNDALVQAFNPRLPFGGVKHSGIGRAGGELGFLNYCNVQSVVTPWFTPRRELYWYPYTPGFRRWWKRFTGLFHGSWMEKIRRVVG